MSDILKDHVTVADAARVTGIKYKALLMRIARGKVKHETLGQMKFIPTDEVERLRKERARANH